MINNDFKSLRHIPFIRNIRNQTDVHSLWNNKEKVFTRLFAGLIVCGGVGCGHYVNRAKSETLKTPKAPNIIYILADDMGYGDVGVYGQELIKTPQIDKMAEEGMRFTQHYAGSTVSAPSRGTLMTGLHTGHAYIRGNFSYDKEGNLPIPANSVTVAKLLKEEGYKTAMIGKWGLGGPSSVGGPNTQGFDYSFGYLDQRNAHDYYPSYMWENEIKYPLDGNLKDKKEQYSHDLLTSKALDFIKKEKDSPFFLYLPYTIPHLKYEVPEDDPYSDKDWSQPMKNYAAMITLMDKDIGKIIDLLKKEGLDENTIVFFSSDNGPTASANKMFNSNGPFKGLKQDLYEGGIRVPLIARWPGKIEAGTVSDHISAFWDFLPTACELANAKKPDKIDGISFLPILMGDNQPAHKYLYWEFFSYNYSWKEGNDPDKRNTLNAQAIRMDNWKAILKSSKKSGMELYNLNDDIAETTDVSKQNPEVVEKIRKYMEEGRLDAEYFKVNTNNK